MIDVDREVNEVRREVGGQVLEAGQGWVVRFRRSYDTTVADLWSACTTPERIGRWLVPVTGDLKVSGHYQLEGNAGGEVLTCEPPHSFTATWEYGGDVSWIDVRFDEDDSGDARVTVEHLAVAGEHWAEFGPAAVGIGWELGLLGLGAELTGDPWSHEAGMAWSASADGVRYIELSGRSWADAHEAAGTPADAARAAAERTVAAYTQSE
ncbi:SRPBCC domain-containing protein [Nocardioidaceae bacterium SCSIO 66511]|nr:SRPBCC domain-containing protein [Nocardioidaceae bacterium SCSIO 66511]